MCRCVCTNKNIEISVHLVGNLTVTILFIIAEPLPTIQQDPPLDVHHSRNNAQFKISALNQGCYEMLK